MAPGLYAEEQVGSIIRENEVNLIVIFLLYSLRKTHTGASPLPSVATEVTAVMGGTKGSLMNEHFQIALRASGCDLCIFSLWKQRGNQPKGLGR